MVRLIVTLVLALSAVACGDNEIVTASRPPSGNSPESSEQQAPEVTISGAPKSTIRDGETLIFNPTVENADPKNLEFGITFDGKEIPSWATLNRETGELKLTPDETHVGNYSIVIYVRDRSTGQEDKTDPFPLQVGKPWTTGKLLPDQMTVHDAASVTMGDSILILGGKQNGFPTNQTWNYNPASNTRIEDATLSSPRYEFGAAAVGNNIYVFGGYRNDRGNDIALNTIEEYAQNSAWSTLTTTQLSQARAGLCSCVAGNSVYITGGGIENKFYDTVDVFTSDKSILPGPKLNHPRKNHQCFFLNNKIYVLGGVGIIDDLPMEMLEIDKPDAVWQDLTISAPRREKATVQVLNGKAYLFGGYVMTDTGRAFFNTVETFDSLPGEVGEGKWSLGYQFNKPVPEPVARGISAVRDGKVLLLGGMTPSGGDSSAVDIYDPAFDYDPANPPPVQ